MKASVGIFVADQNVLEKIQIAFVSSKRFSVFNEKKFNPNGGHQYIVCDIETYLQQEDDFSECDKSQLFVLSSAADEDNMKFIDKYQIQHLIGLNEGIYAQELLTALDKTLNNKIWGLNCYMNDESDIKILSLSDSKFTNEMIEEALMDFDFKDYFTSPTEYIQVMANELISNSLYKGPNKKRSEQGLDSVDRRSPVFLKGSDLVQVTLGMDNKGIALSVQDSFGGLNYQLLLASLKRSFNEKTVMEKKDGAGLGLYLTFLHSNQFIINFRENFRTEVICIIEKNKRYKNYKQRIRSFHFFQEVSGEKTNNK